MAGRRAAGAIRLRRGMRVRERSRPTSSQGSASSLSCASGSAPSASDTRVRRRPPRSRLRSPRPVCRLNDSGAPTNANYAIRGVTKPVAGQGAPGVVSYFADVPLPAYVSSTPQYDLASIQVLKGPQGTLFGRNTVGGALLIDPVAPGYRFDGYLQASYGNFDTKSLEGALNVPIVDGKVALRVAGRINRGDGQVKNLGSGRDFQNQHDNSFRASLLIEPTHRSEEHTSELQSLMRTSY